MVCNAAVAATAAAAAATAAARPEGRLTTRRVSVCTVLACAGRVAAAPGAARGCGLEAGGWRANSRLMGLAGVSNLAGSAEVAGRAQAAREAHDGQPHARTQGAGQLDRGDHGVAGTAGLFWLHCAGPGKLPTAGRQWTALHKRPAPLLHLHLAATSLMLVPLSALLLVSLAGGAQGPQLPAPFSAPPWQPRCTLWDGAESIRRPGCRRGRRGGRAAAAAAARCPSLPLLSLTVAVLAPLHLHRGVLCCLQ